MFQQSESPRHPYKLIPTPSSTAELQAKREEEQCSELEPIQEFIVCLAVLATMCSHTVSPRGVELPSSTPRCLRCANPEQASSQLRSPSLAFHAKYESILWGSDASGTLHSSLLWAPVITGQHWHCVNSPMARHVSTVSSQLCWGIRAKTVSAISLSLLRTPWGVPGAEGWNEQGKADYSHGCSVLLPHL